MKNPPLKRFLVSISAIFIGVLLISAVNRPLYNSIATALKNNAAFTLSSNKDTLNANDSVSSTDLLYNNLQLSVKGLSKKAFDYAMKGFNHLIVAGRLKKENIISIADFSLPSSKKRLFVIDLDNEKVIYNTYVAHGVNSGREMANDFSNIPSSYKSSLGFYETLSTYMGGNGYSLRLNGLEKGINDNANSRDIVIHGAPYVNEDLIRAQGYIGRSWGCPALPENVLKPIVNTIKDGSCLFIYSENKAYLHKSKIINAA
jgi:hypothetical protein